LREKHQEENVKHILTLLSFISFIGLLACSPESKTLGMQPQIPEKKVDIPQYDPIPAQEFKWITEDGGQSNLEFNPKIDILFVTDNSDSMKTAQENLKHNIDKFTAGIIQNRMIDYHIGVTSTWDSSERALKAKKDSYQVGDLRFIKDSKGKSYSQRFLTRSHASPDMIASSIDIGVTPYDQGGPEVEEFFSPLMAAIEKNGHGATNEGFFRDDAQLVVIIMTDADDSTSRISPEQMAQALVDFKQGQADKISVYGVLVRAQDPDEFKDWDLRIHPKYHPECFDTVKKQKKNNGKCTGFGPDRLEQFVVAANSTAGTPNQIRSKFIMGITSKNFGSDLARIGSDITVKTLEKNIFLQQRPRYDEQTKQIMIRVRYGTATDLAAGKGQLIPQGDNGWLYNPDDNSIHLSGHIKYEYVEGSQFAVDLVPLTLKQ
jgi:hypothetical protein